MAATMTTAKTIVRRIAPTSCNVWTMRDCHRSMVETNPPAEERCVIATNQYHVR